MAVVAAGFVGFEIIWRGDVYSGAVQSSSAAKYGTLGINFRARKALYEQELTDALAALQCDMPRAGAAKKSPLSEFGLKQVRRGETAI
jgi:hypothetical protein